MIGLGLILSAAGSIYSGIETFKSSQTLATDLRSEGNIIYQEAMRTANIVEEEGRKFASAQSLQYIGSGVQLVGSALITIAQTKKYAETEAAAVRAKGEATRDLAYTKAKNTEKEGRASLVGGIIKGGASLFS